MQSAVYKLELCPAKAEVILAHGTPKGWPWIRREIFF